MVRFFIALACISLGYSLDPKEAPYFSMSEAKKEQDAPKGVEGFTAKPPEASHYGNPTRMEEESRRQMDSNEVVQDAENASSLAKQHVFHAKDHHLLFSEEVFKNPEAYLFGKDCKEELIETPTSTHVENKECYEAGEPYETQCSETHDIQEIPGEWHDVEIWRLSHVNWPNRNRDFVVPYVDTIVEAPTEEQKKELLKGVRPDCVFWTTPDDLETVVGGRCYGNDFVRIFTLRVQKESTYKIVTANSCQELEQKTEEGECEYVKTECLNAEPKLFKGKPVTDKQCWNRRFVYACHSAPSGQPTCSSLRAEGCSDDEAECHRFIGNVCVEWRKKMRCVSYLTQDGSPTKKRISCGGEPFHCSHGDCESTSYEPNDEMGRAIAELSVLAKAAKDLKDMKVFEGESKTCKRHTIDFLDCCASRESGWGQHLGAKCGAKAVELAKARKKGLCHRVGTACTNKKPLIGCVTYTTSYCCFPSKLVRIIQEQGRKQLQIGWGGAKSPSCRGLTPEELGRIDFSQLDLSELMQEIRATYRQKADVLGRAKNALPFQKSIHEKSQQNPRGAADENNSYLQNVEIGDGKL
ncbi:MAG: conjugal transfer protein TraN [Holosporales bacterium]